MSTSEKDYDFNPMHNIGQVNKVMEKCGSFFGRAIVSYCHILKCFCSVRVVCVVLVNRESCENTFFVCGSFFGYIKIRSNLI